MAVRIPPLNFRFTVRFGGILGLLPGVPDTGFQEVSGISATVANFPYEEGGENRFTHRLPGRITYEDLTLKRGLLVGSLVTAWFTAETDAYKFLTLDFTVIMLNENNLPIQAWYFVKGYPVKWSFDPLQATGNEIFAESITLRYQRYYRIDPASIPGLITPIAKAADKVASLF